MEKLNQAQFICELEKLIDQLESPIKSGNKWLDFYIIINVAIFDNEVYRMIHEKIWQKALRIVGEENITKNRFEELFGVPVSPVVDRAKKTLMSNLPDKVSEFWSESFKTALDSITNNVKQLATTIIAERMLDADTQQHKVFKTNKHCSHCGSKLGR